MEIVRSMIDDERRSMYKGLAVLVLLMVAIIPLSITVTTYAYKQSQQTTNVTNPIAEHEAINSSFWAKTYGGSNFDIAYAIQQTTDGGYIVAGSTNSSGAGQDDFWVFKLNSTGGMVWQKTYGGSGEDDAYSIEQTSDGGYIVAGSSNSFSSSGSLQAWVLKLDSTGAVQWQYTYGGGGTNYASWVRQLSNGDYIVAGATNSFEAHGYDFWVFELNSTGGIIWQKTYGGPYDDEATCIENTTDGGYVVAGPSDSFGSGAGGYDHFWVLKLNSTGGIVWQNTYGGSGEDDPYYVQQTTPDQGYIVVGLTNSTGAGYDDFWVLKLNSTGTVEWSKTYGSTGYDDAYSAEQTADGGYIVAGTSNSFSSGGNPDVWLLKLDSTGTPQWQYAYGGSNDNEGYSVRQTSDGGYVVAGTTSSFGAGTYNVWVLKLEANGGITWGPNSGATTITTTVNPSNFNVLNSTTSVTPANTDAIPTPTNIVPQTTSATVDEQSPQTISSSSGIPLTIIIVVVVVIVLILVLVVLLIRSRSRARYRARPQPTWQPAQQRPVPAQGQPVICPNCGSRNVSGAKFCRNCGASLE
jgi:uncharacterized delta-60 repeat protein